MKLCLLLQVNSGSVTVGSDMIMELERWKGECNRREDTIQNLVNIFLTFFFFYNSEEVSWFGDFLKLTPEGCTCFWCGWRSDSKNYVLCCVISVQRKQKLSITNCYFIIFLFNTTDLFFFCFKESELRRLRLNQSLPQVTPQAENVDQLKVRKKNLLLMRYLHLFSFSYFHQIVFLFLSVVLKKINSFLDRFFPFVC